MKCPSCAAAAADDAVECPSCGLIFAKWREREAKEKLAAAEALKTLDEAPRAAPPDLRARRIAAGAVVLAWMLGLAYYVRRHAAKRRQPLGVETGAFVEVRDRRTGETRRMPVRSLGAPSASSVPAEPSDSGQ